MNALVESVHTTVLNTLYAYIHAWKLYASGKRGNLYIRFHKGVFLTYSVFIEPLYTSWFLAFAFPYIKVVPAHWVCHEYGEVRLTDDYKVSFDGKHVVIEKQRLLDQKLIPADHMFSSKILMCRLLDTSDPWFELDVTNQLRALKVPSDMTLSHLLPYFSWANQTRLVGFDTCQLEVLWDETFDEEILNVLYPLLII
jgi:hypothetical protein